LNSRVIDKPRGLGLIPKKAGHCATVGGIWKASGNNLRDHTTTEVRCLWQLINQSQPITDKPIYQTLI
jgi:hypothetical protein